MNSNKSITATFNLSDSSLDGTWSVHFTGVFTYTGGSLYQYDQTDSLMIQNGRISDYYLSGTGPATGSVDSLGKASWQTSGNALYIFKGTFTSGGTGSGTWTVTITNTLGQNGTGNGTWTAARTGP
jgi:hypothetical protein